MKCIQLALLLACLALLLPGCDSSPYTERKQLIIIPESQELAMGNSAAKEILATAKLSRNPQQLAAVGRVGAKVAAASDSKTMQWEFHVIDDEATPNAFCLPGGKIFVYSGLFKYMQDDAQLATVISHEVGHALARHGAERATLEIGAQVGGAILNFVLSDEDPRLAQIASKVWGFGSSVGVVLPYSRKQEYEADAIGLRLMAKSGYDLDSALRFWDNLRRSKQPAKVMAFLSTHPTDEQRIEHIQKTINEMRSIQGRS